MNTEQLFSNLKQVKRETRSIMDNIRAVKGERHAALTTGFLQASTLTELTAVLAKSSGLPGDVVERIGEIHLSCMSELIRSFLRAAEVPSEAVDEAIVEAQSLEGNVQSMAKTAVSMAEDGRSYGGTE